MTTYDEYGIPVGAYSESESLTTQAWRLARAFFLYRIRPFAREWYHGVRSGEWSLRRVCTLANALVVVWWVVLYWGERGVFDGMVGGCRWDGWEDWEAGANPHRLIFVADPQLIDPHTYPGRPWPLNPLAYKYTDLYLRRTYSRLQTVLYPDTIFFLGDLFDGGREWSTHTTTSPEKRYRKYGNDFWLKEYRRFGDIFFAHWGDGGMTPRPGQRGRKLISSLPGNHDLGFAKGVQVGVRNRFNAYFGDGNRIDVIGNHTFVSIDALSLSALGQDSPEQVEDLWRPTRDFLASARDQKHRAVARELRIQAGLRPYPGFPHYDIPSRDLPAAALPHAAAPATDFPTVLLSHIPLYRTPGTPCGPLREHYPPTPPPPGSPPLETDDRNAIAVRGGYQYQNVLNREISVQVADQIGNLSWAFSGDDHDYCEVVHRGYASAGGGIREVTVKSTSWAMGVRRPGVVLASLWNPVDGQGKSVRKQGGTEPTVQIKLCLLPDQIGTFITYSLLFAATLLLLLLRAALVATGFLTPAQTHAKEPLLPTTVIPHDPSGNKDEQTDHSAHSSTSSTHSAATLQIRSAQARGRPVSPVRSNANGNPTPYTYPLVQHAGYHPPSAEENDAEHARDGNGKPNVKIYGGRMEKEKEKGWERRMTRGVRRGKKGWGLFFDEVRGGVGWVVGCGVGAYVWLVWRG